MELGGLGTTTSALAMGGYDDSSTRAIVELSLGMVHRGLK